MRAVIEQFEGRAEAIYVDDGCSDRTVQILTSQAALDHRINVLRLSCISAIRWPSLPGWSWPTARPWW